MDSTGLYSVEGIEFGIQPDRRTLEYGATRVFPQLKAPNLGIQPDRRTERLMVTGGPGLPHVLVFRSVLSVTRWCYMAAGVHSVISRLHPLAGMAFLALQ